MSAGRKDAIAEILKEARQPVSASQLAARFEVSRQVIVGDIALLRAGGLEVTATPRGYLIESAGSDSGVEKILVCKHSEEATLKELYIIVDHGGRLLNVIVDHPIYGQICAELHIRSRFDADRFIEKTRARKALLLSELTDGVHLHTIVCEDENAYIRIKQALKEEGLLFDSRE